FFRDVGGVVVASALGGAVSGEMFGAGEYAVERSGLRSLKAEDLGACHRSSKIRIFAGALDHVSPASVARNVDHGTKSPGDSGGAGFTGGDGLSGFDHLGIPRGSHRDRCRKDCVIAVDDVEAE